MTTKNLLNGDDSGARIDHWLSQKFSGYSRGYFQRLIRSGGVKVNGLEVNAHHKVKEDDHITVELLNKVSGVIVEEALPLEIIYEDDAIIVVNKPAGQVVHPACGHPTGTLVNALAGHAEGKFHPLLVHRLDKDTSGIMVAAKNEHAKNSLVKQFASRAVKKIYLVAVVGSVNEKKGRIEAKLGRSGTDRKKMAVGPLAKKMAVTEFSVMYRSKDYSLLEVYPLTGRTHQIRVHLSYIGHPILGDRTYGGPEKVRGHVFSRQMLHAFRISFIHPITSKRIEFEAPVPDDMKPLYEDLPHE